MAKDCNYPVSLDTAIDEEAAGNTVESAPWNKMMDEVYYLETTVGVTGSAVTTSLCYKVANTGSKDPGHQHNVIYSNAGTATCLSAGQHGTFGSERIQAFTIGGIDYNITTSAAPTGAILANDGSKFVHWGRHAKAWIGATTARNILAGDTELVSGDSELFDTDGSFVDITNNRITVDTAGYYLILGRTGMLSVADTKRTACYIYKNGALLFNGTTHGSGGGAEGHVAFGIALLAANDYLQLYIYNGDAANRALDIDGDKSYLQVWGPL